MLAALATLAFLSTLWLIGVLAVQTVAESRTTILAALRGHSLLATKPAIAPVRMRLTQRGRAQRPMRAQPRLRAAA
jgi:hypothetical protein